MFVFLPLTFIVSRCLIASIIVPFVKLHRLVNVLTIIFDSLLSCSPLYARLQCEDHIIRIVFITTPREITTELTKLNSFIQRHKRVVSTTLTLRLRGMLSVDDIVWHGEVEAAVGVFEAQCQENLSFLSQQLRKARGVHTHSARIAQEEEGVLAQLNCDLAKAEAHVVALKKEIPAATKRAEEFRRLEEEYKAEWEQLQLRMGQYSAEDTSVEV